MKWKCTKTTSQKLKTSPDAIIQFALQVAYYECYGRMPLTYEAAVTTMFDLGRTETIRTNSKEMSHVAKLVANMDTTDNKQISEKLDFCTRGEWGHNWSEELTYSLAHSQQSKEAMVGLGFDRHLFALSTEAKVSLRYIKNANWLNSETKTRLATTRLLRQWSFQLVNIDAAMGHEWNSTAKRLQDTWWRILLPVGNWRMLLAAWWLHCIYDYNGQEWWSRCSVGGSVSRCITLCFW